MRCQTKLAGMRRQAILVARRMLDGMRPRRQLGEEENGNEKEVAQRIHDVSLIDLDEQTFEIFAFREVQCNQMIGRPRQPADDARMAPGVER